MCMTFSACTQSDALFLANVLKKSFDSDSEMAFGKGTRLGPPGYEDGDPSIIHYFCLDPVFIGKGLGTRIWETFERNKTGIWQLETPAFSLRNHHFYIKLGFKQIGEKRYGPEATAFVFEKHL